MDIAEEALLLGMPVSLVNEIREQELGDGDIKSLIRTCLEINDYDSLWYLIEISNLDAYMIQTCRSKRHALPCQVLGRRDNLIGSLEEGVMKNNYPLTVYSLDLIKRGGNLELIERAEKMVEDKALPSLIKRLGKV